MAQGTEIRSEGVVTRSCSPVTVLAFILKGELGVALKNLRVVLVSSADSALKHKVSEHIVICHSANRYRYSSDVVLVSCRIISI